MRNQGVGCRALRITHYHAPIANPRPPPRMSPHMGDTSDLAIDLRNVTKVYKGKILALQGVDMRVRRGEIFGLLGPNGAGTSTLVKIMMTVVRPTTAEGTLLGERVGHKSTL